MTTSPALGEDTPASTAEKTTSPTVKALEHLPPAETAAFIYVSDMPKLIERWNRLGFRSPRANPALAALVGRAEELLPKVWKERNFDWGELMKLSAGDACLAVAATESGNPAIILGLNVRDNKEKAIQFFELLGRDSEDGKNPRQEEILDDTRIIVLDSLSYFLKEDMLVATTNREMTKKLLRSWSGSREPMQSEDYRAVVEQCRIDGESVPPDFHCYVKPIEFLAVRAGADKSDHLKTARAYPEAAKETGFAAFRGIGGAGWFDHQSQALFYRIGIYAPDRDTTAMQALRLPNQEPHEPPAWISKDIEGFASFYWEMQSSYAAFVKLFDPVVEERLSGTLTDILESIKSDPNGPQIDFQKEFVDRLGKHVLVMCSSENPSLSVWERTVLAFEVTDETGAAHALDRWCNECYGQNFDDPYNNLFIHKLKEHVIFEVKAVERKKHRTQNSLDVVVEPDKEDQNPPVQKDKPPQEPFGEKETGSSTYLTVAYGYLLWGGNAKLLKRLLEPGEALAKDPRYRLVDQELSRIVAGPVSFRTFSSQGDDFRLLARLMDPENIYTPFFLEAGTPDKIRLRYTSPPNSLKTPVEKSAEERQTKPAEKPAASGEIPIAKSFLGPAGWAAQTTQQGWVITGIVLK
ncbi:MAG: hypothetical protein ABSE63_13280 [Thermoguttaceae bacterium]